MAELLPCPFCGGKVRVWNNLETENYDIECQKCGCDVQQHYGCKDEAITAWNTRTPTEELEKLLEAYAKDNRRLLNQVYTIRDTIVKKLKAELTGWDTDPTDEEICRTIDKVAEEHEADMLTEALERLGLLETVGDTE